MQNYLWLDQPKKEINQSKLTDKKQIVQCTVQSRTDLFAGCSLKSSLADERICCQQHVETAMINFLRDAKSKKHFERKFDSK